MNDPVYDRTTIAFHWISAALVVILWGLGQGEPFVPKGPLRFVLWSTHFTLGGLLAAIWVGRVVWRATGGRRLPKVGTGLVPKLSSAVHGLLYLGIALTISLGVATACARGSNVWGLFSYPKLFDDSWKGPLTELHEWSSNLLLLLAAGHALVALAHQYLLRDGVLARMVPRLARSDAA